MKVTSLLSTATLLAALAWTGVASGQVDPAPAKPENTSIMGGSGPLANEITPEVRTAVKKGLAWLDKQQKADGGFSGTAYGGSAAFTALAGLAFMADGNMPGAAGGGEGPYGKNVDKALDRIMKCCQESGLITNEGMGSPMYGHGFATLFLAEAYGQTQRADVKEKLQNAIRLIVQCQNKEGGWRYQPAPVDADLSVTICQVMALRAARNAGIKVPKKTIDDAIGYVKKSQEPDGGFSYMLQGRGSGFPRSAAGLACLYYLGVYQGDELTKGTKYVMQGLPGKGNAGFEGHYFYGQYYAVQAMFMAGGKSWEAWWPAIRKELIAKQTSDGSWAGDMDATYSTSMALIILQVPNRLLPILQK